MHPTAHVFWLFGLSGAGKSTLAALLAADLRALGVAVLSLDGDVMRAGLCQGLGFSDADRAENLRRAAEVARIGADSGLCVIAGFITPLESNRQLIRQIVGSDRLSLIYVNAPLAVCRTRDVKGLYRGAQNGKVAQMTGLTSNFEPPGKDLLTIDTEADLAATSAATLQKFARQKLGLG